MSPSEKRAKMRKSVSWAVHARGEGTSLVGAAVRDASESGIFVHPLMEKALPKVGTALSLTVFPDGFAQGVSARGTMRCVRTDWCRRHLVHDSE